ncbi:MAG TPA: signal recognition particle-docking protein FtsY [Azospirillaceae bacterium]|nr:signal recognition particle-docking protein FtsY [Azospirillaceae bacterium]
MLNWFRRKKPDGKPGDDAGTATEAPPAAPDVVPAPVPPPAPLPGLDPPLAETVDIEAEQEALEALAPPPAPPADLSEPEVAARVPDQAPGSGTAPDTSEPDGTEPAPPPETTRRSWFARMREGLAKSTQRLSDGIGGIFTKRKLDDETLEELEELLIQADLGPTMAGRVAAELARTRFGKEVTPEEVRTALAEDIAKTLAPVARPLTINPARKPFVVLVVGVNGTGKTTTIGKIARQLRDEGKTVWLAAGDTFRAAAVQQLQIWGQRTGCHVIARGQNADPAGLAYDAVEQARAAGADVLLIDTAGRLHNKDALMQELQKVVRVIRKVDPEAPHATLLTLDATTGQNAINQVQVFRDMVDVSGLVVTKLDGSAKGGVVVALADKFKLPVHMIGVGEGAEDLRPFDAQDFARSLVGLR